MRTRIKICGITRVQDALHAVDLGVDALGFMFFQQSPRYIDVRQAKNIIAALAPFVMPVGVFVDPTREDVSSVLQQVPLSLLQFHGNETPEFCDSFNIPYIKAIQMREGIDVAAVAVNYASSRALLLDSYHPDLKGGTGNSFDWKSVPLSLSSPIIISGGLNSANVTHAISLLKPYAVDVSSGVEQAPGIKNLEKMRDFVVAVTTEAKI